MWRDFVRGYFDGDGTFSGSYENRSVRFGIPGPHHFLEKIERKIKFEVRNLTSFISKESIRLYIKGDNKFRVYPKFKIYIKGKGFIKLDKNDLIVGKIITTTHPWLERLHISGSLNSLRFLNWLYENNDSFDLKKINGFNICGTRKFQKCLGVLGRKIVREERLAPDWNDALIEVIPLLKEKYYKLENLMNKTNNHLKKNLEDLGLNHIFKSNKISNKNVFRLRLKYLEYREDLIGSFQKRNGRSNINFYYCKSKELLDVPKEFNRRVDLTNLHNKIKKNLKNLIVYIFLTNERNTLSFDEIKVLLIKSNIFKESTFRPNRIQLDILELESFNILINTNGKDIDLYMINSKILPFYYKKKNEEILREMFSLFK